MGGTPRLPGVISEQPATCSSCYWWRTPHRGRTCRDNRRVTWRGEERIGTPPGYSCEEYTPSDVATCGECVYWRDENRPRKASPCADLNLLDEAGKPRSEASAYCRYFEQRMRYTLEENCNLRVDGLLVNSIRLERHSDPQVFLLRASDDEGVLVKWLPSGPGEGAWEVLPVEVLLDDAQNLKLRQHLTVRGQVEVAFAGELEPVYHRTGPSFVLHGQEYAEKESVTQQLRDGISKLILRVRALRQRRDSDTPLAAPQEQTEPAKRVQDEPWGSHWNDLKEQVSNLRDSGVSVAAAVISVQRNFFRSVRSGTPEEARRLQRQLMAVFK